MPVTKLLSTGVSVHAHNNVSTCVKGVVGAEISDFHAYRMCPIKAWPDRLSDHVCAWFLLLIQSHKFSSSWWSRSPGWILHVYCDMYCINPSCGSTQGFDSFSEVCVFVPGCAENRAAALLTCICTCGFLRTFWIIRWDAQPVKPWSTTSNDITPESLQILSLYPPARILWYLVFSLDHFTS